MSANGQHSGSGSPNGALARVSYKSSSLVTAIPSAMGTRDFGTDLLVAKVPGQPQPISNIEGIRDVVRQTLGAAMIVDE